MSRDAIPLTNWWFICDGETNLVGGFSPPLWKMMEWKSVGMMTFPYIMDKIKHVPNHQPELNYTLDMCRLQSVHFLWAFEKHGAFRWSVFTSTEMSILGLSQFQSTQVPIGSMYAIYGNIYHKYPPNVSVYTIHGSYGVCLDLLQRLFMWKHIPWKFPQSCWMHSANVAIAADHNFKVTQLHYNIRQ